MRPERLYLVDIIAFRNPAGHAYFSIVLDIVWATAIRAVPALRPQVRRILPDEYPHDHG